jgi:hypothetical protein
MSPMVLAVQKAGDHTTELALKGDLTFRNFTTPRVVIFKELFTSTVENDLFGVSAHLTPRRV